MFNNLNVTERRNLKEFACVIAFLTIMSIAGGLTHRWHEEDKALKTCANERYSINNPKECE